MNEETYGIDAAPTRTPNRAPQPQPPGPQPAAGDRAAGDRAVRGCGDRDPGSDADTGGGASTDTDALIERATAQDPRAVEALLVHYLPGLRAFVRFRGAHLPRRKESDSDVVQSVCRDVLENLHQFHYGGTTGFRRWLYRKALRKIGHHYEHYRAACRDVGREESRAGGPGTQAGALDELGTPSQEAIAAEEYGRIERALDQLPGDHREVIVLARFVGLNRAEIGAEMGRSEGAVRTLLSRALARLAELL